MQKFAALVGLMVALAGCGLFHHAEPPAHRLPNNTEVWGNWVLQHPDSTAFAGASVVQIALQPGTFTVTATYPSAPQVVISGTATMSENGLLTLIPQSGAGGTADRWREFHFVNGQPISLLASAAGGSLVFAPSSRLVDPTPSSVWHRVDAARAAGYTTGSTRDTTKR